MLIDNYKHKGLRKSLIKIIREKGITDDKVLEVIEKVPRHFFLETAFVNHAYVDKAFSIGEGQTISQPFTVAFQTQLLNVRKNDKILEIGTGSGYQSSILMELGAQLYSIEFNRKLHNRSKKILNQLNYKGTFICGDGSKGLEFHAPYDKILVTAGAPTVPEALIEQLKINGVLVIPVGPESQQKMLRITKLEDKKIKKEEFGNFRFVKLLGEDGWGLNK